MSDMIYSIFPRQYYQEYTDEQIIEAVNVLKLTSSEEITFTNFKSVQFIHCGDGLEHIFCPSCRSELDIDYWSEAMNEAYDGDSFQNLGLLLPCCGRPSSLEELIYDMPCGFATFAIEIYNPTVIPDADVLREMGKCFGDETFFRMVSAHI